MSDGQHAAGGAGTPTDQVAYENTDDPAWARKALELFQQQRLQVAAFHTDGVVSAQVWGPCPRCGHDIDVALTLTAPVPGQGRGWWAALTGGAAPGGGETIPATVEVGCGCGRTHPQAPDTPDATGTVRGCGVSFRLPTTPPPTAPTGAGAPAAHPGPQDSR